uniref:Neprosin activation peptide domain-containing protein n=1 Tax=Brassica campestris TaxID=3711 RepID=M4FEK7_BRACM
MTAPWLRWTTTLHACFVHAIELFGVLERATPKSVLELVKYLTLVHVLMSICVTVAMSTPVLTINETPTGHMVQKGENSGWQVWHRSGACPRGSIPVRRSEDTIFQKNETVTPNAAADRATRGHQAST